MFAAALTALMLTQPQPMLTTPTQAVELAYADVITLPEAVRPSQFYLWNQTQSQEVVNAVVMALNTVVSRSPVAVVPTVTANGALIRIDLTLLAPGLNDFTEVSQLLTEMVAVERYFHLHEEGTVTVPKFKHTDGKFYTRKKAVISVFSSNVLETGIKLEEETKCSFPIFKAEQFIDLTMSTLDGGFYYKFLKIVPGKTTLSEYLLSRGVPSNIVKNLGRNERAAMFRSAVTGKERMIEMFLGSTVRPSVGSGVVAITYDRKDGDKAAINDPFRNLLDFQARGHEVILEKSNGFHEFSLWDENQVAVIEAPADLACDPTIPNPFTKRLYPPASCIRCHGPDNGWQPFRNEVQDLLDQYNPKTEPLDVFDDLGADITQTVPDVLNKLVLMYNGRLDPVLARARGTYMDNVFEATGLTAAKASETFGTVLNTYKYVQVTPEIACKELGMPCTPDTALPTLIKLIGRIPPAEDGISPEDPYLGALKQGRSINRDRWELVFVDAAVRASLVSGGPTAVNFSEN